VIYPSGNHSVTTVAADVHFPKVELKL
jgi:hypothetical protein